MDLLAFDVEPGGRAVLERLATGAVDLGRHQFRPMAGESRRASPPALTPLLKRFDSSYIGLWRHPLVPGRTTSYVEYVWETSRAREVATSVEQLVAWLFVVVLEPVDDPESDRRWPSSPRLRPRSGWPTSTPSTTSPSTAPSRSMPCRPLLPPGHRAERRRHDSRTGYKGGFARLDDVTAADRVAGCEVPTDAPAEWIEAARTSAPWLAPGSPVSLFGDRLDAGDLPGAWLTLNSPRWPVEPVEYALERLTAVSSDERLRQLADDWLTRTDRRTGGY